MNMTNLSDLFNIPNYNDLIVKTCESDINCSKLLLAAGSPKFRQIFADNDKNMISFSHITADPGIVKEFLMFFYNVPPKITLYNYKELHLFSITYRVLPLYRMCLSWLSRNSSFVIEQNSYTGKPSLFFVDLFNSDPVEMICYLVKWVQYSAQNKKVLLQRKDLISATLSALKSTHPQIHDSYYRELM